VLEIKISCARAMNRLANISLQLSEVSTSGFGCNRAHRAFSKNIKSQQAILEAIGNITPGIF